MMRDSGEGDSMKKYLLIGIAIVVGISLVSAYQTYDMRGRERERGESISEEKLQVENQISDLESLIFQIEDDTSKIGPLVVEEKEIQEEIEDEIEALNVEKPELEEKIASYEEISERDPRALITVDDPVVRAKVEEITRACRTTEEKQQAIFEYVRKEIEYVTEGNPKKWSYPRSFLQFKTEFWQLPRETIEWGTGDCEDQSILLCTMMRIAGVPASDVRVVLGIVHFDGDRGGHAWTEFKVGGEWYALESTISTTNYIRRSEYYEWFSPDLYGWFNDEEYYEEERG
jgi:transglutaminase-like putative cysteine protease